MYLSFNEYQSYGGTLDETTFNNYEFEAEALVDWYTFDRLKNQKEQPEQLTRLMLALIDLAQKKAATLGLGASADDSDQSNVYITKQSNDGVDTTYSSMSASSLYNLCRNEAVSDIKRYLAGVMNEAGHKVLYRGLYKGE